MATKCVAELAQLNKLLARVLANMQPPADLTVTEWA